MNTLKKNKKKEKKGSKPHRKRRWWVLFPTPPFPLRFFPEFFPNPFSISSSLNDIPPPSRHHHLLVSPVLFFSSVLFIFYASFEHFPPTSRNFQTPTPFFFPYPFRSHAPGNNKLIAFASLKIDQKVEKAPNRRITEGLMRNELRQKKNSRRVKGYGTII